MQRTIEDVVQELDAFLLGESAFHRTLERLAARLASMQIDFALAGGLAVGVRGHLRLTVDVDILITANGLAQFEAEWLGRVPQSESLYRVLQTSVTAYGAKLDRACTPHAPDFFVTIHSDWYVAYFDPSAL